MIYDSLSEQHQRLERHIHRLEGRLQALDRHSRRFSWLRLGIVVATAIAVWMAAAHWGVRGGWSMLAAGVAIFAWLFTCTAAWMAGYRLFACGGDSAASAARLALNWQRCPNPPCRRIKRSPLDIDLDAERATLSPPSHRRFHIA
jgi:hypothetical protein